MKKFKVILAVVAMLCLVMSFAGCGTASIKDVYKSEVETEKHELVEIKEDLDGFLESGSKYFFGYKGDVGYIYSDEGKLLKKGDVDNFNCDSNYFYYEEIDEEAGTSKYYYYDYEGNLLLTSNSTANVSKEDYFIAFNQDVYPIVDGKIVVADKIDCAMSSAKFGIIDDIDYQYEDYYYILESGYLQVFNKKLDLIACFTAPSFAFAYMNTAVLKNGNVLIQYQIKLNENAKKFDLEDDGVRYDLVTLILDVKKNTTKEINVNYYLDGFVCEGLEEAGVKDDIKTCYFIYLIKDKKVDVSSLTEEFVTLTANGKIDKTFKKYINGQVGVVSKVTDGRYVAYNYNGNGFLLDQDGKVIGEYNGTFYAGLTRCYYNDGLNLYDVDLKLVKRYDSYISALGNSECLYVKYRDAEGKLLFDVYTNGKLLKTYEGKSISYYSYGYVITDNDDNETLYNFDGSVKFAENENTDIYCNYNMVAVTDKTNSTKKYYTVK